MNILRELIQALRDLTNEINLLRRQLDGEVTPQGGGGGGPGPVK